MSIIKEFKEFITNGSAFDLAIGVIVGGAFAPIIKSMVDDIVMPLVSLANAGKIDFSNLYVPLSAKGVEAVQTALTAGAKLPTLAEAKAFGSVIAYGNFLNALVAFFFLMLGVFILVKLVNVLRKKKEEAPAAAPEPTKTELLLTEIRDALKK